MTDYCTFAEFSLPQFTVSTNFLKIFHKRQENVRVFQSGNNISLITTWTAYTKNMNPSVFRIDCAAVGPYI